VIEAELTVRRLITPAVRDVVTKAMVESGPRSDDEAEPARLARGQPDRRYAVAKLMLSRRELRQHGLRTCPSMPCEESSNHHLFALSLSTGGEIVFNPFCAIMAA